LGNSKFIDIETLTPCVFARQLALSWLEPPVWGRVHRQKDFWLDFLNCPLLVLATCYVIMSRTRLPWVRSHSPAGTLEYEIDLSLGIKAETAMRTGALVPDAMILRLILHELKERNWINTPQQTLTLSSMATASQDADNDFFVEQPSLAHSAPTTSEDPSASFILDGFPRTACQASQLDSLIPINLVVSLRTPFEAIMGRIAGRWVHAPSGRVYNTTFNPPKVAGKDDVTGEALSKREDDNEETWRERLKKFEETSEPLLEHYAQKGVLWEVKGNSSDEISPQLFREFESRFVAGN